MSNSCHTVIVGGTKGLGLAFARLASYGGENVTVLARSAPSTTNERFIAVDVSSREQLRAALYRAAQEGGPFTGLAMFQQYRGRDNAWSGKLACTLDATDCALALASELFAPDGDKSIVLLASNASRFACDEQDAAYHAAKTGLVGLCRHYAVQLGAHGIRVNCVAPGTVLKDETKKYILDDEVLHARFRALIPLRRMGTAAEVAKVIRFLLSADASFITGQEIVVDGGAGLRAPESLVRSLPFCGR